MKGNLFDVVVRRSIHLSQLLTYLPPPAHHVHSLMAQSAVGLFAYVVAPDSEEVHFPGIVSVPCFWTCKLMVWVLVLHG